MTFFFFPWTVYDGKCLRITNAKDLTAAVCYLLKQMGNIFSWFDSSFVLEKLREVIIFLLLLQA